MKLTAKTDVEAPIGFVYAAMADHAAWEREALRRGVEVERPADAPLSGPGAAWRIRLRYRGKLRQLSVRLDRMAPDETLAFDIDSPSVAGEAEMGFASLSPRRTRLRVSLDVRPRTLAARLFVNTLRLARRRVEARFDKRLQTLARRIEGQYQRSRAQTERV